MRIPGIISQGYDPAQLRVRASTFTSTSHDANADGAAEKVIYTTTLPANFFQAQGDQLLLKLLATLTRSAGGPTLTLRARYGGLTGVLLAATMATTTSAGALANVGLMLDFLSICRTTGATGTLWSLGQWQGVTTSATLFGIGINQNCMGDGTAIYTGTTAASPACDLTASKAFVITSEWGANTAGNVIAIDGGFMEKLVA